MKISLKILSALVIILTSLCCNDQAGLVEEEINMKLSKEAVIEKNLDTKFNLDSTIYDEFINSLIFDEKGRIIGAIYDKIQNSLNDKESENFWNHLDIPINNLNSFEKKPEDEEGVDGGPTIFEGYKPKIGGCKQNSRWICVIRDY